ncbi:hypothetical protein BpHYR1_028299 [Brachionus plicatilis]|uniref:Uncharacterized protein n=1 Tax=Brachionus plicatilis TaxID=10195 RepID=A0A3M7P3C3_BRAPC|nr:hypothetical protein BpHYR1_028299 [Brachionus plicatilis]
MNQKLPKKKTFRRQIYYLHQIKKKSPKSIRKILKLILLAAYHSSEKLECYTVSLEKIIIKSP